MDIWIKKDKDSIRLPVLPESFEITSPYQNNTVTIDNLGEINILGKRGLKTISISSFFPHYKYNFLQYKKIKKPYVYITKLLKWQKSPVRLILTGTKINMLVTIENLTYGERDGSKDVYYTLELKEYRQIKNDKKKKKVTVDKKSKKVKKAEENRETKEVKTTTYVVKKGDCLWNIAKKITGNSANYKAIANQNNIKNPNLIYPGQKLVIKIDN